MVTGYNIANGVTTVLGWAIYMDMKHWEFPVYFQKKREMILQHYSEVKGSVANIAAIEQKPRRPAQQTYSGIQCKWCGDLDARGVVPGHW